MAWRCTLLILASRQNAFIESFNGKFRDECLNQNWHTSPRFHRKSKRILAQVDFRLLFTHKALKDLAEIIGYIALAAIDPPTLVETLSR